MLQAATAGPAAEADTAKAVFFLEGFVLGIGGGGLGFAVNLAVC